MHITDPIADMLTRIRNANSARHDTVDVPASNLKKDIAKILLDEGYIVFGLSRHPFPAARHRHLVADVTDEAQVRAAVDEVLASQGRIDLLVNNAGFGISGAVEFTGDREARSQFDVNLFGTLNCIRAVVPHMRERRVGMILSIGSVAGSIPIPFQAFYSAAKAAVAAVTMALQNELRPFSVNVCALLPGDVKTGFTAARCKNETGAAAYPALARSVAGMERDEQNGMDPEKAGAFIAHVATRKGIRPVNTIGLQYKFFCFLVKILPAKTLNWLVGLIYAK